MKSVWILAIICLGYLRFLMVVSVVLYRVQERFFKKALLCGASAAILIHNHPSGDVCPSRDDMKTYETMKRLGEMMNVSILDSIIIGTQDCYSIASND